MWLHRISFTRCVCTGFQTVVPWPTTGIRVEYGTHSTPACALQRVCIGVIGHTRVSVPGLSPKASWQRGRRGVGTPQTGSSTGRLGEAGEQRELHGLRDMRAVHPGE